MISYTKIKKAVLTSKNTPNHNHNKVLREETLDLVGKQYSPWWASNNISILITHIASLG